ncbi:VWA domain-containing protein [Kitasatospora sp. RB6PN24]|uniref:vWA domain-containing protein n=1 Tax=Kitasatospora humi TaxID=2893891 RepID=UPI001E4B2F47|nr:VWA domain-containing protein [Kitasatospora humi]MCC9310936.1 VWA domain-containing protein [Kitasatospora humi]
MADNRGHLIPMYVVADESGSMTAHLDELNDGLASLHRALLGEPMAAAKVRFSVLGFSNSVSVRMRLADLRQENELPRLTTYGGATSYLEAFAALRNQIPQDVTALKQEGYAVYRPAVFFLSDGQPNPGEDWEEEHRRLTDRSLTLGAPNIVACGIGDAEARTILDVATSNDYAFVAVPGVELGATVAKFCTALTTSVIQSGLSLGTDRAELVVDKPEGFRMAIDVV